MVLIHQRHCDLEDLDFPRWRLLAFQRLHLFAYSLLGCFQHTSKFPFWLTLQTCSHTPLNNTELHSISCGRIIHDPNNCIDKSCDKFTHSHTLKPSEERTRNHIAHQRLPVGGDRILLCASPLCSLNNSVCECTGRSSSGFKSNCSRMSGQATIMVLISVPIKTTYHR